MLGDADFMDSAEHHGCIKSIKFMSGRSDEFDVLRIIIPKSNIPNDSIGKTKSRGLIPGTDQGEAEFCKNKRRT